MKNQNILYLLFLITSITQAQSHVEDYKISFSKEKIVLPLTYRNGANPVVEVLVNGKGPYKFMFDTGGAGEARLDVRLFNELKLKSNDSIRTGDGSGKNDRWLQMVELESIALGDFIVSSPHALVRNYNKSGTDKIDGVIGLAYFRNTLVELNFEHNQLIISKGKLNKEEANTVEFSAEKGVPVVTGELNGTKISFNFDTGNMGGLTFHSADITKDIIIGEPKVIGRAQTLSNTFEVKEAQLKVPLKIGSLVFENQIVYTNDVIPHANIGVKFSKQMNVTFDMASKRMKLEKFVMDRKGSSFSPANINEYTGNYEGDRTITMGGDGHLFIQRLEGTPLKMIEKKKDEYGLEIVPQAVLLFERDEKGNIMTLKTSRDNGATWETHKKK